MGKGAEIVTRDEITEFFKLKYKLCAKIREIGPFTRYPGFDIGEVAGIDMSYGDPDGSVHVTTENGSQYPMPIRMLGMTLEELEEERDEEARRVELKKQRRKAARLHKAEEWDRKTYERLKKKFEPEKKT